MRSYDAIAQRTAPLVKQREALLQSVEQLGSLAEVLADRIIEPLRILDKLTQVLPDDTSVQSFKLQGAKLAMALPPIPHAASGKLASLRDVRAPSAYAHSGSAQKESYVIEFTLDPQLYGVECCRAAGQPQTRQKHPPPSLKMRRRRPLQRRFACRACALPMAAQPLERRCCFGGSAFVTVPPRQSC